MNPAGKSALESLGVMGPALSILVLLLNQFVFKDNVITDADVTNGIQLVATSIGLFSGLYGRIKATHAITTLLPPAPPKAP